MRSALMVVGTVCIAGRSGQTQQLVTSAPIEQLQARAKADSNDAAAHYNLGVAYLGHAQYDAAADELRQATTIEPQFADAWLALSIVHIQDREFWKRLQAAGGDSATARAQQENAALYRRAFLVDPLVDVRILGLTMAPRRHSRGPNALDDLFAGRYDDAYVGFSRELASYGESTGTAAPPANLLWLRSVAAARSDRADEAIADLQNLLDRYAEVAVGDSRHDLPLAANELRYVIATLQQRAGRLEDAARLYRQVLENDISNYMAHVQLARIAEAQHDLATAVLERRRAVEANPDDASLDLDLGITLGKAGRFEAAASALDAALRANPHDVRPLYWLGIADLHLKRSDDARGALSRFVALAPTRFDRQVANARAQLALLP